MLGPHHEQPRAVRDTFTGRMFEESGEIFFNDLQFTPKEWSKFTKVPSASECGAAGRSTVAWPIHVTAGSIAVAAAAFVRTNARSAATLGVGVCWDQWYPEAARAMMRSQSIDQTREDHAPEDVLACRRFRGNHTRSGQRTAPPAVT